MPPKKPTKETRRESTHRYIKEHYADTMDQKFERPRMRFDLFQNQKIVVFAIGGVILLLFLSSIWFFVQSRRQVVKAPKTQTQEAGGGWFAVKLIDGETVYGKIDNMQVDPVVINPVYYNYDQVKDGAQKGQKINEAGDLRLVKRGQETHGPDGALEVFKTQFVFMERLKKESRVLQAILQNEQ